MRKACGQLRISQYTILLLVFAFLAAASALNTGGTILRTKVEGKSKANPDLQSEIMTNFEGAIYPDYFDDANKAAESYCWSLSRREPGFYRYRPPHLPPTITEWYFLESICTFGLRSYIVICVKLKDTQQPGTVPQMYISEIECPADWSCDQFATRGYLGVPTYGAYCVPVNLMALFHNQVDQLQICSTPVVFANDHEAGPSNSQPRTLKLAINSRDERGKPKHAPLTWFEDLSPHRKVGQATRFGAQEWTAINGFSYIVTTYPVVIRFCGSAGSAVALHVWRQYNFYGAGLFADQMGKRLGNGH